MNSSTTVGVVLVWLYKTGGIVVVSIWVSTIGTIDMGVGVDYGLLLCNWFCGLFYWFCSLGNNGSSNGVIDIRVSVSVSVGVWVMDTSICTMGVIEVWVGLGFRLC